MTSELPHLGGYPFEVRCSNGARQQARATADVAAKAYSLFSRRSDCAPDIAIIVADEADWPGGNTPYGLPFFNDDAGQVRPGVIAMPATAGEFWVGLARELRDASPRGYARLPGTYPDGEGGVDLQPLHYAGSDSPISPSNYVWFQHRWLRLAAKVFEADGEDALIRLWRCFHATDHVPMSDVTPRSLAPILTAEVGRTLGRTVRDWRC